MKTLLALTCSLLIAVGAAGCGSPGESADRVTVWHWMTDRQEAFDVLAQQYQTETGVKIKLELFAPSDAYTQKIIAAAQASVLPDIYGILDKKAILAAFIKAGLVADLTADFQADNGAWESALAAKALDVNRFAAGNGDGIKPGIYGVPLDIGSEQMLYNRTLLKKAGISKVPATFSEWTSAIGALNRVGISPFVTGFGELWLVDCVALNYAFNIMGEAKVFETFRGHVRYTDPDWIKVLTVFKTLRAKGAFIDGIVTKSNKVAENDFALERAAFAFNGAWSVNVLKSMNPALDYGVAPLPAINPKLPMVSWGGAESSFVVNNSSPRKARAVAFLKWMTAREQQIFLSRKLNNLPANRAAMSDMAENLAGFAKAMESSTHPKIWPVSEDALVSDVFQRGIQAIIIGERTPEAVAAEVQKVKDRQMKKAVR